MTVHVYVVFNYLLVQFLFILAKSVSSWLLVTHLASHQTTVFQPYVSTHWQRLAGRLLDTIVYNLWLQNAVRVETRTWFEYIYQQQEEQKNVTFVFLKKEMQLTKLSLPDRADPGRTLHSWNTHNNRSYPLSDNILPSALGLWHSHSSPSIYTFDRTEVLVEAEREV